MHDDDIVDQIVTIIRHVRRDADLQLDKDTPIDSLGIDSLDFVELMFSIEEKFGIDIPFNANTGHSPFATVGSAAEAVRTLLANREMPA